jgi:regulator of replication initiation timing
MDENELRVALITIRHTVASVRDEIAEVVKELIELKKKYQELADENSMLRALAAQKFIELGAETFVYCRTCKRVHPLDAHGAGYSVSVTGVD